jgi:6-phosphogluconolactonase (cycloisomerase 2 family)
MRLFARKCVPEALKALVLLTAGCAGAFAQGNLYVPNYSNPDLSEFSINPTTGALSIINSQLYSSPCTSVPAGGTTTISGQTFLNIPPCQTIQQTDANPTRAAMTPDNRFLYLATNSGLLDAYSVGGGGSLTPIAVGGTAYSAAGGPFGIAATQKYVYVAQKNGNAISVWSINQSSGALTSVACALCSLSGGGPTNLVIDPTNIYVYIALPASNAIGVGTINAGTGAFSSFTIAYTGPVSFTPQDLVLSPAGNYLYATDGAFPGNVYAFPVTGATLGTPVVAPTSNGSNFALEPIGIGIDPSGTFLFVANYATSNVTVFKISTSPTLALNQVAGSPFASGGSGLEGLTVAPSGNYVYVANLSSGSVTAFSYNTTTGVLSTINTVSTAGGPFFPLAHLVPPPTAPTAVPAASTWSLAALGILLAGLSGLLYRKAYR